MTSKKMQIKDAVILVFSVHGWGNRKKVDSKKVEVKGANKDMINATKKLIDEKGTVDKLKNFQNTVVKGWIQKRSVPGFFSEGTFLFKKDQVSNVETFLQESAKTLSDMVEEFLAVYPEKIKEVEALLGPDIYNANDYPTVSEMRERFRFSWRWVKWDVPNDLPEEVRQKELAKAEAMWADAAEQITMSLREGFKEMIAHAVELLKGKNGTGRGQIGWKDSSFDKINEFIDLFKTRNLTNDDELEQLVEKARQVLSNVNDPQRLKKNMRLNRDVREAFTEITATLDTLIVQKPKRAFSFDD